MFFFLLTRFSFNFTPNRNFFVGSKSSEVTYTRKEIFFFIKEKINSDVNDLIALLEKKFSETKQASLEIHPDEMKILKGFIAKFRTEWRGSPRLTEKFLKAIKSWINATVNIKMILSIVIGIYIFYAILLSCRFLLKLKNSRDIAIL